MGKVENNLLFLVIKEKKIIITGAIIGLLFFLFYYIFFYVPLFNTSCKVFIKNIQNQNVVTENSGDSPVKSESGYSNPLFNLNEILKSQNTAFRVYENIHNKYPEDLAKLNVNNKQDFYLVYQKLIKPTVQPSTDVIEITLLWPNPKNAADVLNEAVKQFKEENLFIRKDIEVKKSEFLDVKTEEITKKLEEIRNQIMNYKLSSRLVDINQEGGNLINARIDLEKQAKLLKSQIDYNDMKLKEYSNQLGLPSAEIALRSTGIGIDPYLVKLSQDLAIVQQNYARARSQYTDKYPDVIALKNEIDQIQKNIDKRKAETVKNLNLPRAVYDNSSSQIVTNLAITQAETVSLREQLKALNEGINQFKSEEARIPSKQLGLDFLEKQEDAFIAAYQKIKEKQLEAKIKESEVVDNVILLNSASKPLPISLSLLTKLVGFLAVGTIAGFGLAYLKQGIENKWFSQQEIEVVTKQRVLGSIPWLKDMDSKNANVILEAAYSNIASEIKSLAYLNEAFILSFISTNKSKNKSFMAEIIANNLAKSQSSVLLIDLVATQNQGFDIVDLIGEINKGLRFHEIDIDEMPLSDIGNIVHPLLLKALKTKQFEHNGSEIAVSSITLHNENMHINDYIATKGFSLILKYLRQQFEFILINAPHGLIMLPEIQTIKQIGDASIIISSMNTNRDDLIKVVDNFVRSNAKILGIITREENSELEKSFEMLELQEA